MSKANSISNQPNRSVQIHPSWQDPSSGVQKVTFKITGTAGDLHFKIDNVKFGS